MEKSASELASQIMQKAIEISDNTKHDVCAYYYGHTKAIDVDIYKNGWREDVEAVNLKTYLDMEGCIDELKNILKELEKLEENYYMDNNSNSNNDCIVSYSSISRTSEGTKRGRRKAQKRA